MSYAMPSLDGDLSVIYAPAHHARTTSKPFGSSSNGKFCAVPTPGPSLGGDLSVTYAPAHHTRTTSEPMGSIGFSFPSSGNGRPRTPRPVLRIITDLPCDPTTH